MEINWREVAKAAYAAYGATTDYKNFRGEDMPGFDKLPEKIQTAWIAAVMEAHEMITRAVTA